MKLFKFKRKKSHDWLSALQSNEFQMCQVINTDDERTCVECVGKFGTYRAFFDALGKSFILQWIISHPSIGQLDKKNRDDITMRIAQVSTEVELEFKENMARVRVIHLGIQNDYYLAIKKSVNELDSVIPILSSTFGGN